MNSSTDRLELAARFVNTTGAPIFLTGKAGTGKTTFLRDLAARTHKRYVILAPTGIAALNAKGVTIHSQFLLPFGSFLPTREPEGNFTDRQGFFTQQTMARRHPLNQVRRKVLKAIDLLVIDEVSMLRADILDAIDYRMRSVKGNYQVPFGGVQVLLIGDLYQLPPVVKDEEWTILSRFYNSMHFFEAKALQQSGMVYLELDKIFRQQDETFIRILNNLRDNKSTPEDVRRLNQQYKTLDEIQELMPCITLTTHNYKADELNLRELRSLASPSFFYDADLDREFPESMFPLPPILELKEGARVMFIKNDSSGNGSYYNGKLATVIHLAPDEVKVQLDDSADHYVLKKELWENKRYQLHAETKELEEEVIGTFSQYPIKLAWAVTVHKSQGLTFDKAIVDVGQAFAPGQVYVALSRLRSLEGLILRTRIQTEVIFSDAKVVGFTQEKSSQQDLLELLQVHQQQYLFQLVERTFELDSLIGALIQFQKDQDSSLEFEDEAMQADLPALYRLLDVERENTRKFRQQLQYLIQNREEERLLERLEKGAAYYLELLLEGMKILLRHLVKIERLSRVKSYQESMEELELEFLSKYTAIARSSMLIQGIFKGEGIGSLDAVDLRIRQVRQQLVSQFREAMPAASSTKNKSGKKKSSKPKPKVDKEKKEDTKEQTIRLFLEGKTPEEIASDRGLTPGTILNHLTHGVKTGKIQVEALVSQEAIWEIQGVTEKPGSLKAYFEHFEGKYDYDTLRLVLNSEK
jgi:energy-coupling factor transporter ATP-binding protein EcfA2